MPHSNPASLQDDMFSLWDVAQALWLLPTFVKSLFSHIAELRSWEAQSLLLVREISMSLNCKQLQRKLNYTVLSRGSLSFVSVTFTTGSDKLLMLYFSHSISLCKTIENSWPPSLEYYENSFQKMLSSGRNSVTYAK